MNNKLVITIIFFAMIFLSCKKEKTADENLNCKVTACAIDSVAIQYCYYDEQGRLIKMTLGDKYSLMFNFNYTYVGNTVIKNDGSNATDITYLNSFGLADSIIHKDLPKDDYITKYKYNSLGEPIEMTITGLANGYSKNALITMEYSGGNLIKETINNGILINYTYYLDQENSLKNFDKARRAFANRNMLKSMVRSDNKIELYAHEYDKYGKVIQTTRTDVDYSNAIKFVYTWSCD